MAAYVDDEMLDDENDSDVSMIRDVSEDEACVIEQTGKRQKACPGQKRRVVTVAQWDIPWCSMRVGGEFRYEYKS